MCPDHIRWLGVELAILPPTAWHPNNWATLVSAKTSHLLISISPFLCLFLSLSPPFSILALSSEKVHKTIFSQGKWESLAQRCCLEMLFPMELPVSRLGQEINKMSLEHLVIRNNKLLRTLGSCQKYSGAKVRKVGAVGPQCFQYFIGKVSNI